MYLFKGHYALEWIEENNDRYENIEMKELKLQILFTAMYKICLNHKDKTNYNNI